MQKIISEIGRLASNMYRMGWNERNGGNISVILDENDIAEFGSTECKRIIPIGFSAKELAARYIVVTGTGKYFKNVETNPSECLGLVRVCDDGENVELLWGFEDGGRFTSEFPAHLMTHIARLKADKNHRVVIHAHPTNTVAMTHVVELDEREFTRTLWQMCTECLVVFPDGIGVLPWMLCGTDEIGQRTAEKMQDMRLVVWAIHGIFGTGKNLDEAFGLIETVEKAAELYMKISATHAKRVNVVSDAELWQLARLFNVSPRDGYLD